MKHLPLLKPLRFALVALLVALAAGAMRAGEPALRVLILSGQNNHNWRETTPRLKSILENGGRFAVDVETNVAGMKPEVFSNTMRC